MSRTFSRKPKDYEWWVMACCSLLLHLAVYLFILNFHFSPHFKEAPVYYVDVLNLPVASPQAGMPSAVENPPAPPQPATPQPREMTLPSKPLIKAPATAVPTIPPKPSEATEAEIEERIARLEGEAEARHQADALKALKDKASGKRAAGMPGGAGTEAGSDYASYIKSRLEDEFKLTIAYQSKNPDVYMKLVISPSGRIIRQQIVKSSKDKVFEDSVFRSIVKAERNFRPPPSGNQFEITVKFSPQGIGKQ